MIVFRDKKVCIVTPPKCGTTSLHHVMCPPGHFCEGPQLDNVVGKHTWVLPFFVRSNIEDFTILIATRHPYRRLLSLYGHYKSWWEQPDTTFEDFIFNVVIPNRCQFLSTPVSSWVFRFQEVNPGVKWHPYQLEQTEWVQKKYGLEEFKVPHIYKSKHNGPEDEYTEETLAFARRWGRYDFKFFGYDQEPWW